MEMVKNIRTLLMLFVATSQSCIPIPTRNLRKFTIWNELKKDSDLTQLKINGIYYRYVPNTFSAHGTYIDTFILYANGAIYYSGAHETTSLDEMAKRTLIGHEKYGFKYIRNNISKWGAFIIQDDILLIQYFETGVTISAPIPPPIIMRSKVFHEEYKIVNGSTLVMYSFHGKLIPAAKRDTFYLYPTKQKPDSTNLFMTNKRIRNKLERLYKKRHPNDKLKN